MGYEDRDYYREETDDSRGFAMPSELTWSARILIVLGILFLINLMSEGQFARGAKVGSFDLPGLGFSGNTLTKPWLWWQYLTSGFVFSNHDVWPVVWCAISLFFFGPQIEEAYGRHEFLTFFVAVQTLASISMGILAYALGITTPIAMGASLGTSAIVLLFCLNFPYRSIVLFFVVSVPAWLIGAATIFGLMSSGMAIIPAGGGFNALSAMIAPGVVVLGTTLAYFFFRLRFSEWLPTWLGGTREWQGESERSWSTSRSRSANRGNRGGSWWNIAKWWRAQQTRKSLSVVGDDDQTERDEDDELESLGDRLLEKLYRDGESSLSPTERAALKRYSELMRGKRR